MGNKNSHFKILQKYNRYTVNEIHQILKQYFPFGLTLLITYGYGLLCAKANTSSYNHCPITEAYKLYELIYSIYIINVIFT